MKLAPNYGGMQIIEDASMLDYIEDWSGVRSHGRAKRRRERGFPQRIRIVPTPKTEAYQFGNKLVMHPAMASAMRAHIAKGNSP